METTPVHSLSISGVLSESNRIVNANYSHFIGLSLFFLPLAFSIIITPTFRLAGQFFTVDHLNNFPPNFHKPQVSHLLYILIVYVLALCAIATITYSTYHGFSAKPIRFFTALKSLTFSFVPLVSTTILIHVLLFCISLSFLLFVGSMVMLVQNLGFVIDYNSINFMWFSAIVAATLLVIIIYFYLNWSLAFVIAVTESKLGLGPLMRSSYLVKGVRSVSLSLLLYFGIYGGLFMFVFTDVALATGLLRSPLVFPAIFGSIFLMVLLLVSTAANTVLYMYCKALHGELEIEIAEKPVSLNLHSDDDEKVSHIVTVAAA
ncbi:uncharacterized protein LOC112524298 [Cynara cardunculus var. scolymus]|uniref:uncharacterized protein LOC112524298 n=1 Tax=Cynara cardunculus var. scolymus TaxID=59895 RepID=UPI000D6303C3|nr:uncharacterized protein LOC112524298 [Cynara cardunculus var. scolymus]